jgi:hypothetical protein
MQKDTRLPCTGRRFPPPEILSGIFLDLANVRLRAFLARTNPCLGEVPALVADNPRSADLDGARF